MADAAKPIGIEEAFVEACRQSASGSDLRLDTSLPSDCPCTSVNTDPSNDDIDDGQAAEVAASRLEAQIDDLTSSLGHWCLADLKGWRRRRAAVAAASATISSEKADNIEDDAGMDLGGSCSSPTKPSLLSPTKRSPSVPVPCSPSEKEFLRQRRREARRSMLRGVAATRSTRNGGRKLEM